MSSAVETRIARELTTSLIMRNYFVAGLAFLGVVFIALSLGFVIGGSMECTEAVKKALAAIKDGGACAKGVQEIMAALNLTEVTCAAHRA